MHSEELIPRQEYNISENERFPEILKSDDKGKVVSVLSLTEHHAIKAYWGSGSIAPRVLNLGIGWR
jgi:hypothetical protein